MTPVDGDDDDDDLRSRSLSLSLSLQLTDRKKADRVFLLIWLFSFNDARQNCASFFRVDAGDYYSYSSGQCIEDFDVTGVLKMLHSASIDWIDSHSLSHSSMLKTKKNRAQSQKYYAH
jgi:hypothetical protein